ncbi:uncharacterized protein [Physcomitrium patens]|uniref:uncharacterized protein n=1 Tax=Physcomitrium patens TaxID=3218 RepID=UPI003CCD5613
MIQRSSLAVYWKAGMVNCPRFRKVQSSGGVCISDGNVRRRAPLVAKSTPPQGTPKAPGRNSRRICGRSMDSSARSSVQPLSSQTVSQGRAGQVALLVVTELQISG